MSKEQICTEVAAATSELKAELERIYDQYKAKESAVVEGFIERRGYVPQELKVLVENESFLRKKKTVLEKAEAVTKIIQEKYGSNQ
jgi:hypothetical protein